MMRLILLAAFFCAAPLSAADITAPKEVPQHSLVRVSSVQEGTGYAWWILATDATGKLVFADVQKYDQDRSLVFTGPPGTYQIMLAVSSDGKLDQGQATVTILGAKPVPPGPTPVPPGPTPPPDPPDPPDPTPSPGPRAVILIRETAETTPALSRLITGLRSGPAADYLKSNGHKLSILDDDAVDSSGQPSAVVKAWLTAIGNMPLPALVVADVTDGKTKVLYTGTLTEAATADTVLNTLKANGG